MGGEQKGRVLGRQGRITVSLRKASMARMETVKRRGEMELKGRPRADPEWGLETLACHPFRIVTIRYCSLPSDLCYDQLAVNPNVVRPNSP